ncbi:MAG: hypothetical protein ACKOU7_03900 [Ferruginibacter sp.]
MEAIWPQVLNNEIEAISIKDNRKLKPEELNSELAAEQPKIVPIYDSTSRSIVLNYQVKFEPVNPGQFTDVELAEDWYYDKRKNKVYANIKELVLYLPKSLNAEQRKTEPALRLIFKQEN